MTVRTIIGPTILLHSGNYFDFLNPTGSQFTIEDIAHGLSNTCRFVGQCNRFYSVAQHSVHASTLVPAEDAYAALMHDAPEAFIGDVSRPLKDLLQDYRALERTIEDAVFERFNVPNPLPASVKKADIIMLITEQRQIMNNLDDWDYTRGMDVADIELPIWGPAEARNAFLTRFKQLSSEVNL